MATSAVSLGTEPVIIQLPQHQTPPRDTTPFLRKCDGIRRGLKCKKCVYLTTRAKASLRPQDGAAAGMFLAGLGKGAFYTMTQTTRNHFQKKSHLPQKRGAKRDVLMANTDHE